MTIFLDTSAWVKFFLQEEGTTRIQDFLLTQWLSGTHVFTASPITYAETLSTLKRAHRGQRLGQEEFEIAVNLFEEQWANTQVVTVNVELIARSGQLAKARVGWSERSELQHERLGRIGLRYTQSNLPGLTQFSRLITTN